MKIESIREVKANLNKIVSALPEEGVGGDHEERSTLRCTDAGD
jgi:hypothetical protein